MNDTDWRSRAHDLENRLMWTGAAIDVALVYLKHGQLAEAEYVLQARRDDLEGALKRIQAEDAKTRPAGTQS
jgi:hypothetical protein